MRKLAIVVALAAMLAVTMFSGLAAAKGPQGPAPNSGDCIPDGPGWEVNPSNGNPDAYSPGPAPNSGDGVPDGPGWEDDPSNGNPDAYSPGPAPNSGDGDSDGPGW